MKKLKTILNSNYLYFALIIILIFFILGHILLAKNQSIYHETDTDFALTIKNYLIKDDKITFTLSGKEDLIATYYIKTEEEGQYLKEHLAYGTHLELTGTLNTPLNNTIPYSFNYKKYLNSKDIYYTLKITEINKITKPTNFIYKIKNIINKRIARLDKKGYLKAFILGSKDDIDKEIYEQYQNIGITHLFALSGMHVGLLSGIFLKLLKNTSDSKKYLITNVFLILYGFIVGFPSSIKRCLIFFFLNSLNKLLKLELSSLKLLLITISIIIFTQYKVIYDIAFRYSIATVLGIILSQPYINNENKLLSSFRLSLVAFLYSMPISLTNFYQINFLSIIYNMFFVPLVSIIIYPLSLLTFILPIFNYPFLLSIQLLENISSFLNNITIAQINLHLNIYQIILFYIALYFIFSKRVKIAWFIPLVIIIGTLLSPFFDNKGYIYFFDIGQGDSCLVISPQRKDIILIDTGGIVSYNNDTYLVSDNVITFMKALGLRYLDQIILSHGDADHAKEVANIAQHFKINYLKLNPGEENNLEKTAKELISTQDYQPRNLTISYFNTKDYHDENANSLQTLIKMGDISFLTLGDAPTQTELDLISNVHLPPINIFKVSHHGSNTSSSYQFLQQIKPNIAIISSGRHNRFNHPSIETTTNLEILNINYLNTQTSGTIAFTINQNKVTYQEYKP